MTSLTIYPVSQAARDFMAGQHPAADKFENEEAASEYMQAMQMMQVRPCYLLLPDFQSQLGLANSQQLASMQGLADEKNMLEQELKNILVQAEAAERMAQGDPAAIPLANAAAEAAGKARNALAAGAAGAPSMLPGVEKMLTADEGDLANMLEGANQDELMKMMQTLTMQRDLLEQEEHAREQVRSK